VLADHVLEAARDCFSRIGLCSVWAWDGGSRPFFWNWKEEFHEDLIRGMTMWIREPIVPWTRKQPAPAPQHRQQVLEKLDVIRSRGSVGEGQVESLICFLAVQKGASDIRIVYDGTRSGLNDESAHRGNQDAARKRRDVSQTPGAWAGSVVHTTDSSVTIMVEQTKWDKTKVRLQWVSCQLEEGPNVEHKPLERVRGFLNYVMPVYPSMIPYLRGFHGALDSWRSNRTADGFDKPLNKEGRRI